MFIAPLFPLSLSATTIAAAQPPIRQLQGREVV
jgi:hypothetical protein